MTSFLNDYIKVSLKCIEIILELMLLIILFSLIVPYCEILISTVLGILLYRSIRPGGT